MITVKGKQYTTKEAIDILNNAGFKFYRDGKGSHRIYERNGAKISIPANKKEINRMMFKRLCRENNIAFT